MPVRTSNIAKELVTNRRIAKGCALALVVTGAALLSCRSSLKDKRPVIDTRITCTTIQPLKYVKSDSKKTKEAIIAHNAVWDHYCLGEGDGD